MIQRLVHHQVVEKKGDEEKLILNHVQVSIQSDFKQTYEMKNKLSFCLL